MSKKEDLRIQRKGTVINKKSKRQETILNQAIKTVIARIEEDFTGIQLILKNEILLSTVISDLKSTFPKIDFAEPMPRSSMRPDGGILYLIDKESNCYPILITEKKNQGTNDSRKIEGKPKQAKGNAIERLGKNVIGLRTYMLKEDIFPFICFGDGCDFAPDSSIIDRVITIAMFGHINQEYLCNNGLFNRGTFLFREEAWTEEEMVNHSTEIATRSIYYYFAKYGKESFL